MAESRRVDDLRRRVREDPASIVFAQLAEEYRRAGRFREAVAVCRAGLAAHPGYLSARVTLGRALSAMDKDEEAGRELRAVLAEAPENLAALRAMADLHRRRGELPEAVRCYRIALDLARGDFELDQTVRALMAELAGSRQALPVQEAASAAIGLTLPRPVSDADARRERARRTLAHLEQWLSAIHGSRTLRRA
jgi:tetratricopeptide (TPR) repeat protein